MRDLYKKSFLIYFFTTLLRESIERNPILSHWRCSYGLNNITCLICLFWNKK